MSDKSLKKANPAPPEPKSAKHAQPQAGHPGGNSAAQEALRAKKASTAPYTDVYGHGSGKGAAFQVDGGQLTFDAEGTEGGRFHSRKSHVPPGPSGVTVGRGYDLGQHTGKQIVSDMVAAGIAPEKAKKFATAAGKKEARASAWVRANGGLLGEITPEQQEALFDKTYGEMSKDVQRISDKKSVQDRYGAADLDDMTPAIKDTLVDLRYRGDYTGGAREKVQEHAANNDLIRLTDSLSDRKAWKNVPEDRFRRRAAYLKEAEVQAEGAAYGFAGMPMEQGLPTLEELRKLDAAKKGKAAKQPGPRR